MVVKVVGDAASDIDWRRTKRNKIRQEEGEEKKKKKKKKTREFARQVNAREEDS